jgi:hypothetical protein
MKTNKGMVAMPQMTLNALKQMLFSNENGVDLTNIINDLAVEEDQKDLVAIHVALVHKGIAPEFDKSTRYEYTWGKKFRKLEYVKHSLILGSVTTLETECTIGEHGDIVMGDTRRVPSVFPFDRWVEMTTDVKDILPLLK